ncbi:MAG: TonB-dependent receptor [Bryobacteraceae bacterium]|nr:TonB-dependent receptor [Bryobacteraceae bacterium]
MPRPLRLTAAIDWATLRLSTVSAQSTTAKIVGTVTDSTGAVLVDAKVTITEERTSLTRNTTTNAAGIYTVPYIPSGTYTVAVGTTGFKTFSRAHVDVAVSSTVRVDATLTPGDTTETVMVTAETPLLQTDRGDVNRTVTAQQVQELPVPNRSFQALVGLLPGLNPPAQTFTALEDPQRTTFYNANGQGAGANNTQVDGVEDNNPTLGLTIYIPQAEIVQEVNVSTSNYNAEFGRAGGAVLNVITKGGTNKLSGSAFEFNRNAALRARNLFNRVPQPKPAFNRNQFGATIGGPIRKNKTFFFAGFQGALERQASTQVTSVPADEWRNGDFRRVPDLALYDPGTGNADGTGRQRFANNVIPANRLTGVAARLNPLFPWQNQSGFVNNYVTNVPFSYDGYNYDGRVDHQFNERNQLYVKYNYSRYAVAQSAVLGQAIGEGTASKNRTHTAIMGFTRQWSPSFLMEVRAGYNRYLADVNGDNIDDPLGSQLGIANPNPDPISTRGLPRFNITGLAGIGTPVFYPLVNTDNLYNLVNTWTKITGRHTLKWGADLRDIRADRFQPQGLNYGPRGRFDYNPGTTSIPGASLGAFGSFANSYAAFLIGAPDATYRTFQTVTPSNRIKQYFFFFHDSWQVTSRLTLDLGIRYEAYTPVKVRFPAGGANYNPANNSLLIAGFGDVGLDAGVNFDANNWAPRFGFAYRLTPKTVIRGGYGMSYYTDRFGFSGGTISTQFPVIYNVQEGVTGDFRVDGIGTSLPPLPTIALPSNGIINPAPNQGFFSIPADSQVSSAQSYNLTVQRELPYQMAIDVGYVGTLGRHGAYSRELNFALPGTGAQGLRFRQQFGRTASVQERGTGVNSNYNSLQTSLRKRFNQGLTFGVSYTWSKSMNHGDPPAGFTLPADVRRNYGRAGFDRKHMLVVNHTWELPFGPGKALLSNGVLSQIAGSWQLNGILQLASGTPVNIVADAGPCACPGNGNFADVRGTSSTLGGVGAGQLWFDTSAFAAPAPNTFGNGGRNTVRGPSLRNYDFSVFRNFPITERARLQFRAEFYNLTNTPQPANPNGNVNSAAFGQITSTLNNAGERQVQFGLRFLF